MMAVDVGTPSRHPTPVVSVITPVYNGERYLEECIRSVLGQTFSDWEYLIADNASTDSTALIAERYANRDSRIRLIRATEFVSIYANHNRAMRQMDPRSRYCKIIHADDWLDPECLERMIAVADAYPSAGLVGALRSVGGEVEYRVPLDRSENLQRGREVVRREMLGMGWGTGSPSTILIRADLIRQRNDFYDTSFWHGDTDAAYRVLMFHDFGFVHQVLTHTRVHSGAQSSFSNRVGSWISRDARLILRYGAGALRPSEHSRRVRRFVARYGLLLAGHFFRSAGRLAVEFRDFNRREIDYALAEADGEPTMRRFLRLYRRLLD